MITSEIKVSSSNRGYKLVIINDIRSLLTLPDGCEEHISKLVLNIITNQQKDKEDIEKAA